MGHLGDNPRVEHLAINDEAGHVDFNGKLVSISREPTYCVQPRMLLLLWGIGVFPGGWTRRGEESVNNTFACQCHLRLRDHLMYLSVSSVLLEMPLRCLSLKLSGMIICGRKSEVNSVYVARSQDIHAV